MLICYQLFCIVLSFKCDIYIYCVYWITIVTLRLWIEKSLILFWRLNMTIWCKHVRRLELHKFLHFCVAHLPVRLDIETKFLISNYWQPCQKKKYGNFVFIISLNAKCATQKIKSFCSSILWTCLHHIVILRSQNKITDFVMILAWLCRFKVVCFHHLNLTGLLDLQILNLYI